ncbi:unnamed protein product, partial [marine sediment metagenome]
MSDYNPLKSYPYSKNRLLIIDWSSLAYHQWFAIASKNSTAYLEIDDSEDELYVWRTRMINKMVDYIKLFNPRDILITLEGTKVWRNQIVRDYYNEHTTVYYDKSGYYLRFDNFLYKATKNEGGGIDVDKLDIVKDADLLPATHKKLGEMPDRAKELLWRLQYISPKLVAKPALPKYKGTRSAKYWPFMTEKKDWKNHKEEFAKQIQKVFRSHTIGQSNAEGDDAIYVA